MVNSQKGFGLNTRSPFYTTSTIKEPKMSSQQKVRLILTQEETEDLMEALTKPHPLFSDKHPLLIKITQALSEARSRKALTAAKAVKHYLLTGDDYSPTFKQDVLARTKNAQEHEYASTIFAKAEAAVEYPSPDEIAEKALMYVDADIISLS